MKYDLVVINGDSFSEGNGLYRQFTTYKEECKYYDYWLELQQHSTNEVFLDRSFSWGLRIAELLGVPLLNISKSGSSNKSILRRWYYLCGIAPTSNPQFIYDYKVGEENWVFLEPNKKVFKKHSRQLFKNYKNPLCITQWSGSYRADMAYKSLVHSLNPGMNQIGIVEDWLKNNDIPVDSEKFHTFFSYFTNFVMNDYLVQYENLNNLMAYNQLMQMNGFESYSIAHRMANTMDFGYDRILNNVLPIKETKRIEENTYTLKDVGIENLHYSLEGHEYFGESILNMIQKDII
jgi:hypothetical protein